MNQSAHDCTANSACDCGIPLSDLIDLEDHRNGAYQGGNPKTYARLEAHVEHCAQCQHALESMRSLDNLSGDFFAADAQTVDNTWLNNILANIPIQARAGRLIPLDLESENTRGYNTEGSLRALVRRVATNNDLVVTRVHFDGDLETKNAPIHLTVRAAIRYGSVITPTVAASRARVAKAIAANTNINLNGIDFVVVDVLSNEPESDNNA